MGDRLLVGGCGERSRSLMMSGLLPPLSSRTSGGVSPYLLLLRVRGLPRRAGCHRLRHELPRVGRFRDRLGPRPRPYTRDEAGVLCVGTAAGARQGRGWWVVVKSRVVWRLVEVVSFRVVACWFSACCVVMPLGVSWGHPDWPPSWWRSPVCRIPHPSLGRLFRT